jgi:hypothetical protein
MTGVMMGCSILSLSIVLVGGRVVRSRNTRVEVEEESVEMIYNS